MENAGRLRAAVGTEPGRLRLIGAVLAGLTLLFGLSTYAQLSERAEAAKTARESSQPLSRAAAEIYRSLADANTTAASGFLAGAAEPTEVRDGYTRHINNASELLSSAAGRGGGSPRAEELISHLNIELPRYTGLVEAARANDRQGLPLGSAYLRYADLQMQEVLLTSAADLYRLETARYQRDLADARSWPWLSTALGGAALLALGWAQWRQYRRTNRVLNPGLVAASTATVLLLGWLVGAQSLARSALNDAENGPGRALTTLSDAWTEALVARGSENLTLVSRGGDVPIRREASSTDLTTLEQEYQESMDRLLAEPDGPESGLLRQALTRAGGEAGRAPVAAAIEAAEEWRQRHQDVVEADVLGDYDLAIELVLGEENSTGQSFDRVDAELETAVEHQQREFRAAAGSGVNWLGPLPPVAAGLALLAGAAVVLGIGRRLAEYR
ncbi:hypothetical protein K4G22_21015 [Streptomyces profundus]|nr:hypothetical protein K4G22_21015 [Streptomyces sp. MA3_2.13]